ncbi:MAG: hypothetical protein AB1742_12285 [bacterium]
MRNLNASLCLALFFFVNVWVLVSRPVPWALISLAVSSPLLVAAVRLLPGRDGVFRPDPLGVPASFFPYVLSLFFSAGLVAAVYLKTAEGDNFFLYAGVGRWTVEEAAAVLALSLGLSALGFVIRTSAVFGAGPAWEIRRYSVSARLMSANATEAARFVKYLYTLLFFWAVGVVPVMLLNPGFSAEDCFILAARSAVNFAVVPVGALLGLPVSPFMLIGMGGYFWALANSFDVVSAAAFTATAVLSACVYIIAGGRRLAARPPVFSPE